MRNCQLFRKRRVASDVEEDWKGAMEIFEGTQIMDTMYSRKGHGKGQKDTILFWGIRAKD